MWPLQDEAIIYYFDIRSGGEQWNTTGDGILLCFIHNGNVNLNGCWYVAYGARAALICYLRNSDARLLSTHETTAVLLIQIIYNQYNEWYIW